LRSMCGPRVCSYYLCFCFFCRLGEMNWSVNFRG
jgi:hypothetical protein